MLGSMSKDIINGANRLVKSLQNQFIDLPGGSSKQTVTNYSSIEQLQCVSFRLVVYSSLFFSFCVAISLDTGLESAAANGAKSGTTSIVSLGCNQVLTI